MRTITLFSSLFHSISQSPHFHQAKLKKAGDIRITGFFLTHIFSGLMAKFYIPSAKVGIQLGKLHNGFGA
jgi:hypothetical protein